MNTVLITGAFDLCHLGHIEIINYAKTLGDVYVALDSDERIKRTKGYGRPIMNNQERALCLYALGVKHVAGYTTDQELETLVNQLKPDVRLVGSDHKDILCPGTARHVTFPRTKISTTSIIERIRK